MYGNISQNIFDNLWKRYQNNRCDSVAAKAGLRQPLRRVGVERMWASRTNNSVKEARKMAQDPGIGYKVAGTITGVKGMCNAGHTAGDTFEISCHNPAGLCGFFYHDIFPNLSTFQFGGSMPWWQGDTIELQCPDTFNLVTMKLTRSKR